MIPLTIGTWNVHKLIDRDGSDIPQCRTALVGIELGKCKIAITVVGEAHLAEVGKFKESVTDYLLFLSGRRRDQRPGTGKIKNKISCTQTQLGKSKKLVPATHSKWTQKRGEVCSRST